MNSPTAASAMKPLEVHLCRLPSEILAKLREVIDATSLPYEEYVEINNRRRQATAGEVGKLPVPTDWHLHPDTPAYVRRDGRLASTPIVWPSYWDTQESVAWLDLLNREKVTDSAIYYKGWQYRVHAQVCHTKDYQPVCSLMVRRVIKDLPLGLVLPTPFLAHMRSPSGFIAISGDTGSGKSTSLTRLLIDMPDDGRHIAMYENPPEFRHKNKPNTLIRQYERGMDFNTLAEALSEQVLRKDVEVLVPTELRDDAALAAAVGAAGSGHLVIATMHLSTAPMVVGRVMGDASVGYIANVAANLRTVLCQKLVPVRGGGRMAVFEHLSVDETVRSIIARTEATSAGISSTMMALESQVREAGLKGGSWSFEHSLCVLVERKRIDLATALDFSSRREWFKSSYEAIRMQNEKFSAVNGLLKLYDGIAS